MDKKEFFLFPNILTILRFLTVIPVCILLFNNLDSNKTILIVLFFFMYITDLLDGYFARKLDQVSETGKILDPLADKAAVGIIAAGLFIQGLIPVWFFVIILSRDFLILLFGLYLKKKYNKTLMSNYPGKAAVFGIGLILLLTVINSELLINKFSFIYYLVILLIIYSSILYFNRFLKTIGDTKNAEQRNK